MVNIQATAMPMATKTPKTCTGGIGENDSEKNPAIEVKDV